MRTRGFLLAVLIVTGMAVEAQQFPPGKWWRRPEIARELKLSAAQQERLDGIFRAAADDLIDARAAVDKLQIGLRSELERPQLRRQELQRIAGQLSAARGKLFEHELMMLADMRAVLDEGQWRQMRERLDGMRERRQQRQRPRSN